MAHEKEKELLEKFSHFVNDHYAFGFLQLMFDDIDLFLSTLPEEKEESIISKLDEWISDCEKQSNDFFKRGMTHSEMGSMAMAQAYKNVKELFNPSK